MPRSESREMPHTPWPDVQPLAIRDPTPTSRPATARTNAERRGFSRIIPTSFWVVVGPAVAVGEVVAPAPGVLDERPVVLRAGGGALRRGALLLVSDVPVTPDGVKTEESDRKVTSEWVALHLQIGIEAMTEIGQQGEKIKHFRY